MNCSRSCLRRLFGIFSLGITKRSRGGTLSPISCISPSTIHHSDLSSSVLFSIDDGENLDRLLLGDVPASVLPCRSRTEVVSWIGGHGYRANFCALLASDHMRTEQKRPFRTVAPVGGTDFDLYDLVFIHKTTATHY